MQSTENSPQNREFFNYNSEIRASKNILTVTVIVLCQPLNSVVGSLRLNLIISSEERIGGYYFASPRLLDNTLLMGNSSLVVKQW